MPDYRRVHLREIKPVSCQQTRSVLARGTDRELPWPGSEETGSEGHAFKKSFWPESGLGLRDSAPSPKKMYFNEDACKSFRNQ